MGDGHHKRALAFAAMKTTLRGEGGHKAIMDSRFPDAMRGCGQIGRSPSKPRGFIAAQRDSASNEVAVGGQIPRRPDLP